MYVLYLRMILSSLCLAPYLIQSCPVLPLLFLCSDPGPQCTSMHTLHFTLYIPYLTLLCLAPFQSVRVLPVLFLCFDPRPQCTSRTDHTLHDTLYTLPPPPTFTLQTPVLNLTPIFSSCSSSSIAFLLFWPPQCTSMHGPGGNRTPPSPNCHLVHWPQSRPPWPPPNGWGTASNWLVSARLPPQTPYSHFVCNEQLQPSLTAGFRNCIATKSQRKRSVLRDVSHEGVVFTSSTFIFWGKSGAKTSISHLHFFSGKSCTKPSLSHLPLADFEGNLARKLRFYISRFWGRLRFHIFALSSVASSTPRMPSWIAWMMPSCPLKTDCVRRFGPRREPTSTWTSVVRIEKAAAVSRWEGEETWWNVSAWKHDKKKKPIPKNEVSCKEKRRKSKKSTTASKADLKWDERSWRKSQKSDDMFPSWERAAKNGDAGVS